VGFALDLWISHRIPLEWPRFAHKRGRYPFPTGQGGSTTSPPIYPGNSAPPGSPALRLVKEGYTAAARQRNEDFSAARQDFCPNRIPRFGRSATDFPSFQLFPTFRPFGHRFSIVSAVSHVSAVRPPFFQRFGRATTVSHVSALRTPFSPRLGRFAP